MSRVFKNYKHCGLSTYIHGGLFGGGGGGGIGNSTAETRTDIINETTNITQGVQEGGVALNVGEGAAVNFTDGGAVEDAFEFADNNQAFANENFESVIGLAQNQNRQFFAAFNELNQAENSLSERALEVANNSRSAASDNLRLATSKLASIAQAKAGDIRPILMIITVGGVALFAARKFLK